MATECSSCHYENPLGARYCMSCGHRIDGFDTEHPTQNLEQLESDDESSVAPPGMLVVRQGSKSGSRIALDADLVTLGRHPESDVFLNDITVSRRHAEIRRTGDRFEVSDAGSLNGTYVNKSLTERAFLNDGDELQVGKFKLVFVAPEGAD